MKPHRLLYWPIRWPKKTMYGVENIPLFVLCSVSYYISLSLRSGFLGYRHSRAKLLMPRALRAQIFPLCRTQLRNKRESEKDCLRLGCEHDDLGTVDSNIERCISPRTINGLLTTESQFDLPSLCINRHDTISSLKNHQNTSQCRNQLSWSCSS